MVKVTKLSPFTGKENTLDLPISSAALNAWLGAGPDDPKRFVQVSFPDLSDAEREFLVTGITPQEWDDYMPDSHLLPEGETRPDSERVDDETDAEVLDRMIAQFDHPTAYTEDDDEDWLGKGQAI